ncbi:MAG: ATP-binding cassette domain-containing protein, partial [Planctomycetota bacterium]|nr:ATP-binding cassette domain-containing protein [Planctomycetota bacterium]
MALAADNAVEFEDVCVSLAGVRILEHVRARVPRGSATAIIGPNGAGKTTLLLSMLGQVAYEGRISVHGPRGGQARIGYVPQSLDFD